MQESTTTIVAFDQHADSVMAAGLPPDAAKPASQALSPDLVHIGRLWTSSAVGALSGAITKPGPVVSRSIASSRPARFPVRSLPLA